MSFLTVEDVNSASLQYTNDIHIIDTSKISLQEFEGVLYDFCIVSHHIDGNNHIFTFEVHNTLWCGEYHALKNNGGYITDCVYNSSTQTITVTTTESNFKMCLYLCSFYSSFNFRRFTYIPNDRVILLKKNEIGTSKKLKLKSPKGFTTSKDYTLNLGVNDLYWTSNTTAGKILVLLKKTDLIFDIDSNLTVGIVNRIYLNVDNEYLPNGSLVDEDLLDIIVKYGDIEIPVAYDSGLNDYYFDLDLTDKIDNKSIKLEIIVNEIDLVNASKHNVTLPCNYSSASSYQELQSHIVAGVEIIELTNDITFNSNLIVPHNLLIYANKHNIYLGSFNILVSDNVSIEIDDANFFNGTNCFIQQINSKLVLSDCRFANAIISDNYKGSVISADYDGVDDSIITELIDCTFINCHHTIYHGGELTIKNCKALFNNFNNAVDTDYPAFLTAYDGTVELTNSIFDIDYDIGNLCNNNVDIKFAEALVGLGENTIFNGFNTNQLKYNDALPFFEAPYNNKSHIFAKYYYPQINSCVISSPILNKEDSSVCHMILGIDWVFKNNVQVTRVDWENENNVRKIDWGEI